MPRIARWALDIDKQEFVKWFEASVKLQNSFVLSDINTFAGYVSQSYLDQPTHSHPTVDNGELRFDLEIPDLTENEVIAIREAMRKLDRIKIAVKVSAANHLLEPVRD